MAFDAKKYLIQLKGRDYLETKWRLVWFRQEHPQGSISTEVVSTEPVLVRAVVKNGDGLVLGTAHASATDNGKAVWSGRAFEKAETAAIGRALAHAGYGTQFAGDEVEDTDHLSDSPVERPHATNGKADSGWTQEEATIFLLHWRGRGLTDKDVLAALGVTKLSEWTKGRGAADRAVDAWLDKQTMRQV